MVAPVASDSLVPLAEAAWRVSMTPRELLDAAATEGLEVERVGGRCYLRAWSLDALLARGGQHGR